jgi:hypothetical protein
LDWPLAIDRNRDALRRIVAALFALAGLAGAGSGSTLPRHVYSAVMLVLRPAESAVRRLIVIAARGLLLKPRAPRPSPEGLPAFSAAGALRTPAFCLLDPLKRFSPEAFDNNALPRFSFDSDFDPAFAMPMFSSPDEPVEASQLFGRLRSLRNALNTLPRQARRLARWQARRDLMLQRKGPFRPMRLSAMRPGPPPGRRLRATHEVDDVLRECHRLALDRLNEPNTS